MAKIKLLVYIAVLVFSDLAFGEDDSAVSVENYLKSTRMSYLCGFCIFLTE